MNKSSAHCFAFFYPSLSNAQQPVLHITDSNLIHRMHQVLRINVGEHIIVFDRTIRAHGEVISLNKKECNVRINTYEKNQVLSPFITVLLPLIKRAAFEQALYLATELGANAIQLLTTQKTQSWRTHDYERAQRIIIAAAEQSKQFNIPTLHEPIALEQLPQLQIKTLVVADMHAQSITTIMPTLTHANNMHLLVGPEGDFTDTERTLLQTYNAHCCSLTPTTLRTEHAMALLLGICRSFL